MNDKDEGGLSTESDADIEITPLDDSSSTNNTDTNG